MKSKDFTNATTLIVVSPADLKEFALEVVNEVLNAAPKQERLYTPTEFAEKMHVDRSTLWRWCKVGILKPTRMGGKVFYKESDLKMEG